jgi:hypothetical protein
MSEGDRCNRTANLALCAERSVIAGDAADFEAEKDV